MYPRIPSSFHSRNYAWEKSFPTVSSSSQLKAKTLKKMHWPRQQRFLLRFSVSSWLAELPRTPLEISFLPFLDGRGNSRVPRKPPCLGTLPQGPQGNDPHTMAFKRLWVVQRKLEEVFKPHNFLHATYSGWEKIWTVFYLYCLENDSIVLDSLCGNSEQ